MAPRRWLLLALSLGSLVVLAYAMVAVAFSVPVSAAMAEAARPAPDAPETGLRAVVQPLANPGHVPTHHDDGAPAWLIVADRDVTFPSMAENASLVHAIAYVSVLHDRTYAQPMLNLTNLTALEEGATVTYNATVDLNALAEGRSGFLVKTPSERDVRFVQESRVLGQVARFESSAWTIGLVALGSIGFVAPLVALLLTARPTGRPGVTRGLPAGVCPECRRGVPAGSDFCTGCGAWLTQKQ